MIKKVRKYSLWTGFFLLLMVLISLIAGFKSLISPFAVSSAVCIALGMGSLYSLKDYQYTAWIIVAIVCGLIYPSAFLRWGDFDLRNEWVILIVVQLVMFGMGTQMRFRDFSNVRTMSKGVLVGILCQFTVMPLVGYMLTRVFHFEPEISAGIVLIGSCSSGLASNVMAYLAKANITLSVTLTSVATLLAPVMTPFWMKMLAGTYIQIGFLDMCIEIIQIVIVPIGAAMLVEVYKTGSKNWIRRINAAFVFSVVWLIALIPGFGKFAGSHCSESLIMVFELLSFFFGALVVGKVYYHITVLMPAICGFMPKLSMFGIVYFTVVTTAASRENILTIGLLMLVAAILHNGLGYTFGYGISRALRLDKHSSRTIALEVGLQNGGMASGLAGVMGKLATLGLAAAIFSPWMNISGSLLGNYWRKKNDKTEIH